MDTVYVFLDMDGVVLPYHPHVSNHLGKEPLMGLNGEVFYTVWSTCVDILNQIGDLYPCRFILNSTWKRRGNRAANALQEKGFKYKLEGVTPPEEGEYRRSHAVSAWFEENGIDENAVLWVALDDEFFSYKPQHRGSHLLHCNLYTGLFVGSVGSFEKLISEQLENLTRSDS